MFTPAHRRLVTRLIGASFLFGISGCERRPGIETDTHPTLNVVVPDGYTGDLAITNVDGPWDWYDDAYVAELTHGVARVHNVLVRPNTTVLVTTPSGTEWPAVRRAGTDGFWVCFSTTTPSIMDVEWYALDAPGEPTTTERDETRSRRRAVFRRWFDEAQQPY